MTRGGKDDMLGFMELAPGRLHGRVRELYRLLYEYVNLWEDSGVNGCNGAYSRDLEVRAKTALEEQPDLYDEMEKFFKKKPWRSPSKLWDGGTTSRTGGSRPRSRSARSSVGKGRTAPRPSTKRKGR
jgi:hypothetical protein